MLIDNKKWIAFFSHTGNEIYNISKELGRYPDRVITNKSPGDSTINKKLARNQKPETILCLAMKLISRWKLPNL